MIRGVHITFYTEDAEGLRAFFRDTLGLPCTDVGGGWLICDVGEAELAAHPVDGGSAPPYEVSFYTDDIDATVAELRERGAEIVGENDERNWGRLAHVQLPSATKISVYEPKYGKRA
jgi:predicted enzyme related to lactoylglutathione lyase